jgi:hypothetical protein
MCRQTIVRRVRYRIGSTFGLRTNCAQSRSVIRTQIRTRVRLHVYESVYDSPYDSMNNLPKSQIGIQFFIRHLLQWSVYTFQNRSKIKSGEAFGKKSYLELYGDSYAKSHVLTAPKYG